MKITITLNDDDLKTLNDCLTTAPVPYFRTVPLIRKINDEILKSEHIESEQKSENTASYTHE